MRRIVLDTNCLIQVIPLRSKMRFVWDAYLSGEYTICVSNEILNEYHEMISTLGNPQVADLILSVIINSPYTEFFDPRFRFNIITEDPDDNKFVDCAIVSQAEFIVSNDHHFDEVKRCPFPKVDVVTLQEFSETLAH